MLLLAVVGVFLTSLLAAGGGERDPLHDHIVIGGTPADRARALAAHLSGTAPASEGGTAIFGETVAALPGRSAQVQVFVVTTPGDSGPAVLSGGGAIALLAQAPIRFVTPTSKPASSAACTLGAPQRDLSTSEPPPRPA